MKNISRSIAAIAFSLALFVPVVANATTQDDKKAKTEVKKDCKKSKKCCAKTEEKKCCDKAVKCTGKKEEAKTK